jgi:murein DD-endopeptidase MepM/ murein hydrolase activator NlpD
MVFIPAQPPPTSQGQQPWYTYPRIDNFGQKDPAGDFWKPDSNVQVPGNYPITALLPGTVTSIQNTSFGQKVVTIKLDHPLNSLATHTFYEHMSGSAPGLSIGQHVQAGSLIGYNNPSGQVPLGFGLYSGDVYGSGSEWGTLQQDLAPGGAQQLNPVNLLNQAQKGNLNINNPGGLTSSYNQPVTGTCAPWDIGCMLTQSNSALASIGEAIAIFVLALVLIVVGFFLLAEKQAGQVVAKVAAIA